MDTHISSRKDDHLRLAGQFYAAAHSRQTEQIGRSEHREIDDVQFIHNSLPETNRADVSRETSFAGIHVDRPFFINAMTGGTEKTNEVNRRLAAVAQKTGIPLALGSMSIAVKNAQTRDAYKALRQDFPDVCFIANLGAEHTLESAGLVTDLIGASALQIHLNAAQEIVMPEGERDFTGWIDHISQFVSELGVPVIVKEVGFGMSYATVAKLLDIGVMTVDIAGRGGTNFIQIENARNAEHDYDYLEGWGISTLRSLSEALFACRDMQIDAEIIASGGVQNPLDIVKYLALGADAVGLSAPFLHSVTGGSSDSDSARDAVSRTVDLIQEWDGHIANIMTILGVTSIEDLRENAEIVLPESLVQYLSQRFAGRDSEQFLMTLTSLSKFRK
ncbi:type 2 isopentenyl-diphosphate Delta-isomerase [Alloscardovia venturai]|uniref:Isopentenyl-diphosphate delta-isomerase n=1 Tax=Alloscardovia venturai TaxID=1769421 RepID=A0ABW2Y2U3_9BIFI